MQTAFQLVICLIIKETKLKNNKTFGKFQEIFKELFSEINSTFMELLLTIASFVKNHKFDKNHRSFKGTSQRDAFGIYDINLLNPIKFDIISLFEDFK